MYEICHIVTDMAGKLWRYVASHQLSIPVSMMHFDLKIGKNLNKTFFCADSNSNPEQVKMRVVESLCVDLLCLCALACHLCLLPFRVF